MAKFAERGSQKWLRISVNSKHEILLAALRKSGALGEAEGIVWKSPLERDPTPYGEYQDVRALVAAEITDLRVPLEKFWPRRGPVWDAIGVTSNGAPVFVEAKAHISEAASPATKASEASKKLIRESLKKARSHYAWKSKCDWSCNFYQYANRLAYHYFLRKLNSVPSRLVFLYFLNDQDLKLPATEDEWRGAIRLIHSVLGVPPNLKSQHVFEAFVDVRSLA
jgi:hypothetical protein